MSSIGRLMPLSLVGALSVASVAFSQAAVEWKVSDGGNGHWYALYKVSGDTQSPEVHFQAAIDRGGHTATIASSGENAFVFQIAAGTGALIGVRKQAGNNRGAWVTGEAWNYTKWHAGEGNNSWERYVLLNAAWSGDWQDTDLTPRPTSVIEWDADCNGDGIVDYGQIRRGQLADYDGDNVPDVCEGTLFLPQSLDAVANLSRIDCCCPGFTAGFTYPTGLQRYGGVPFVHGADDRYGFSSACQSPPGSRQFSLAVDVPGDATLYALLSSWGGCGTSWADFRVTAEFVSGRRSSWLLVNGVDYRDHNGICPLTGSRSHEVWNNGGVQHLDLLTLAVGAPGERINRIQIESVQPGRSTEPLLFGLTFAVDSDCDGDGVVDFDQIFRGQLSDTNNNLIPDRCENPILVPLQFPTIQAAIDAATQISNTIFVSEGLYGESIDLKGKSITIKATGSRANTILDGTGLTGPVIRATSGETSATLLQGFTIRNGTSGSLVNGQRVGGGMLVQNASPTIRDCAFVSNSAEAGGGLAAINSQSVIDGCTFSTNAAGTGGGLWLDGGRPSVTGCVITGNSASGHGGGLYATPMPGQLPNVVLAGNTLCSNTSVDAGRENLWALFDDGGNAICDCFGDVDGNGVSDTADISLALLFFGSETDPEFIQPDQDMNGTVDTGDVALLLLNFGPCG